MDNEYFEQIKSSPYVDEAFISPKISQPFVRGAHALKNILPSTDPYSGNAQYTAIMHFYNAFVKDIAAIVREFSGSPTSPASRLKNSKDIPLSSEQKEIIQLLIQLQMMVSPLRDDSNINPTIKESFFLSQNNKNIISLLELANSSVKEGWGSRFLSRAGGDNQKIIDSYINDIKTAYNKFIKNISKYFQNEPKESVINKFKELFQNNINKIKVLTDVENVIKVDDNIKAKNVEPTTSPSSKIEPAASVTKQPVPEPKPSEIGKENQEELSADDFVFLIAKSLEIINNRVYKSDATDASVYFNKQNDDGTFYQPTSWEEPLTSTGPNSPGWSNKYEPGITTADEFEKFKEEGYYKKDPSGKWKYVSPQTKQVTKEEVTPPSSQPNVSNRTGDETAEEEEETAGFEETGDFVYDFAGTYKKQPRNHSVEATLGGGERVQFPSGAKKIIKVWWTWGEKHDNYIKVEIKNEDGSNVKEGSILKFFDNEVNPRGGVKFDIEKFLEQSSNNSLKKYREASQEIKNELQKQIDISKISFYVIIRRKSQEFVAHKQLKFGIKDEWKKTSPTSVDYGAVVVTRAKVGGYKKGDEIDFATLKDLYHRSELPIKKSIKRALDKCNYWTVYSNIKEKFENPSYEPPLPTPEKPSDVTPASPTATINVNNPSTSTVSLLPRHAAPEPTSTPPTPTPAPTPAADVPASPVTTPTPTPSTRAKEKEKKSNSALALAKIAAKVKNAPVGIKAIDALNSSLSSEYGIKHIKITNGYQAKYINNLMTTDKEFNNTIPAEKVKILIKWINDAKKKFPDEPTASNPPVTSEPEKQPEIKPLTPPVENPVNPSVEKKPEIKPNKKIKKQDGNKPTVNPTTTWKDQANNIFKELGLKSPPPSVEKFDEKKFETMVKNYIKTAKTFKNSTIEGKQEILKTVIDKINYIPGSGLTEFINPFQFSNLL